MNILLLVIYQGLLMAQGICAYKRNWGWFFALSPFVILVGIWRDSLLKGG